MDSIEKERAILKELCDRIREEKISLQPDTVSQDNVFSVFGVLRKEVPYCRVLLYLIRNNWESFHTLLQSKGVSSEYERLIFSENEHACEAPCRIYDKQGRIDVFLQTENHIYAIEAKVDAGDQEHQLARYQKYLNDTYSGQKNIKIHIIYLTMTGYSPDEYTRICRKCQKNCEAAEVTAISWEKDICDWLETIVDYNQKGSIAEQFFDVLKLERSNLVHKHISILEENPELPEIIDSLSKSALPEFWKHIRRTFFERLAALLKEEYLFEIKSTEPTSYNNEVWEITLCKNGHPLYICYECNLFLRTGEKDKEWKFIDSNSFTEAGPASTSQNRHTAVNMLCFKFDEAEGCNRDVVNWYYKRDDIIGKQILGRIASSVNEFFENQT